VLGLISDKADVMPSHSTDCNPQANQVWSVCKRDANKAPHNSAA